MVSGVNMFTLLKDISEIGTIMMVHPKMEIGYIKN
jgi:hypothetical protein